MNKVQLMGRLTKDVELRETASGRKLARFVLACSSGRDKEGNEITNFIPCGAWEKRAEVIARYFKKGHRMLISSGEVIVANYVESESQEKRVFTYIRVNDFEFVETKRDAEQLAAQNPRDEVSKIALDPAEEMSKTAFHPRDAVQKTRKAAGGASSFDSMGDELFQDIDF